MIGGSEEYTHIRALGNVFLSATLGLCTGRYLSDALNGFKLFRRSIYQEFPFNAANFEIEFWLNKRVIPVSLMVAPSPEDPWDAEVALVSGAVRHEGEVKRVVMALDIDEETGERKVIAEVLGQAPQRDSEQGVGGEGEEDEAPGDGESDEGAEEQP